MTFHFGKGRRCALCSLLAFIAASVSPSVFAQRIDSDESAEPTEETPVFLDNGALHTDFYFLSDLQRSGLWEGEPTDRATENSSKPAMVVSEADAALVRQRDGLKALRLGELPPTGDVNSLFNVRVDAKEEVSRRLDALPAETAQLGARRSQLLDDEKRAPDQVPPPIRPALLDNPPKKPEAPVAPVPPAKPPQGATAKDFGGVSPRTFYRNALESFEREKAAYRQAVTEYEAKLAAYEAAVEAYREADRKFEHDQAAYKTAVDKRIADIRSEVAAVSLRIEIATLRKAYLSSVSTLLARFSEPALITFQSLDQKRQALRKRADTLLAIEHEAEKLRDRLEILKARAAAGSLLGFLVQRGDLSSTLDDEITALSERIDRTRRLAGTLDETASQIESEGKAAKAMLLSVAEREDRDAFLDKLFLTELRRSRTVSRVQTGYTVSDAELETLKENLAESVPSPGTLATVADAEAALVPMRFAEENFEKILDTISLGIDRHRQAFSRELVTVYSSLASEEVKGRAYSLSVALVEDFIADLNMVRVEISLWAESRVSAVTAVPESIRTVDGLYRPARIVGGMLMVLILFALRKRIRQRVAELLLRLVNRRAFRRRAGTLVRLTVFLSALLPILPAALAGYGLLALVGFDYPEVRIAEVAFRWGMIYYLGRQVLHGLTAKESRGRPPLLELSDADARLAAQTYARLGLFLALIAAVNEWTSEWLGTGSLGMIMRLFAFTWAGVWALWAQLAWRKPLASACANLSPEGTRRRSVSDFVNRHLIGFVFTPVFFLWILEAAVLRGLRRLLAQGGLLSYFRARALRRMSRKTQSEAPGPIASALPEQYTKQFPLYPLQGEEGEVLLPRRATITAASHQIARWRSTRQDGSLVIIGEKGIGKTTCLALLEKELSNVAMTRHTLKRKMRTTEALLTDLGEVFGLENPKNLGMLARHLNDGPERVVLLDEAHNVFLRAVDGFQPVDALVSLVDFTSDKVFWVLVFNKYSWAFLTRANRHVQSFRKQLRLPAWTQAELQDLVARRNKKSGIAVEFDEVLLDAESSSTGGFELISSAEGFFRLLFETSRGNPRTATYLWLRSLTRISDQRLRAGLIREESIETISKLDAELLFALASFAQHENLSFHELHQALHISLDEAAQAGRYLLENGILETKHSDPTRMTLSPRFHHQVLKVLKTKNLLYAED